MRKRALILVAAVTAVAAVLAFTVSPISPQTAWAAITAKAIKEGPNTPAPKSGKKALKILRADVMKAARDYSHKRYRAVCSDLTKRQRTHLGGTSKCIVKISALYAFMPVKKFTIITAKLTKKNSRGEVWLYVDRNKDHVVHGALKWEGGAYRLDHQSGWHPNI
jgi:hypothetical protein